MLHATRRFAAPAFAPVLTNLVISAAALAAVLLVILGDDGPSSMAHGLGAGPGHHRRASLPWPSRMVPYLRRSGIEPAVAVPAPPPGGALRAAAVGMDHRVRRGQPDRTPDHRADPRPGPEAGTVSAYQYAFIFFQLPYGLIAVSLMTAVLPELAEAAARPGPPGCSPNGSARAWPVAHLHAPRRRRRSCSSAGRSSSCSCSGASSTPRPPRARPRRCSPGFSLGLPAFAVFLYCVRAFHARRNTRTPFYLNLFENVLNVVTGRAAGRRCSTATGPLAGLLDRLLGGIAVRRW